MFSCPNGTLDRYFITEQALLDEYVKSGILYGSGVSTIVNELNPGTSGCAACTSLGPDWKNFARSYDTTLAQMGGVKADGTLWGWGANLYSMGRNNTTTNTPVQVYTNVSASSSVGWKLLCIADAFSAALNINGTLWTCGLNNHGQIGNNDTTAVYTTPYNVPGSWIDVSVGSGASGTTVLAIKADGTLWSWGANSSGMGGNSFGESHIPAREATSATDWASISCGIDKAAGLKSDGSLWWIGDGYAYPYRESTNATDWKFVTAGYKVYGIKTNGTLWNIPTDGVGTPVEIPGGGFDWKFVDYGAPGCTMGIKTDGTVWAWGEGAANATGSFGNGTAVTSATPTKCRTMLPAVKARMLGSFSLYLGE